MDADLARQLAVLQTWFTGFIALLTFLYVLTTWRQLKAMRKALEETRRSNEATEQSNRIQREAMIAANRAWVAPEPAVVGLPAAGDPAGLEIPIRNPGRFPARKIIGKSGRKIGSRFTDADFIEPQGEAQSIPVLFPGTRASTTLAAGVPAFTEEDIREIQTKQTFVTYFAVFTYDDGMGNSRETRLSVYYNADTGTWDFDRCGNSAI